MAKDHSNIESVDLQKALGDRYLAYALSTIMARSLPDVRDGLKPVHRRLIYAMHQLKLNPTSGFKKCARVVGDVMGKFHPHGDAAIYGAMVRLAQEFSVRYPLIEGQGNFGNIDGDNAAAMRYTEARLSDVAIHLIDGLDENAVDFRPTYDGELDEPMVFPSTIPNLLANGSTGIAVGMATNIPPHNLDELCKGLIYLIDHPDAVTKDLMPFVLGPDFPTGGIVMENPETILRAYESGSGSFRIRARWHTEDQKGGGYKIIITEIPYMVEKSKLIEKIAELLSDKKLSLLGDVVDESADDIRIVLEPKTRNVEAHVLMESLYRTTDLETRFAMNMNVLDEHNTPKVMSLKDVLSAFLKHRRVVLNRRTSHRLQQIIDRLEILSGYLVAYLNIDDVIRIIRDEDDPKIVLMETYNLSDRQAESILNMRLKSLRKLQEIEIRKEHDDLTKEQDKLNKLLASESQQWKTIRADIITLEKKFGKDTIIGKRRTDIQNAPEAVIIPIFDTIEREDVMVVLSVKNWIRTIKGHQHPDVRYKDGDDARFVFNANTADKLLIFATNGRFYTIGIDKLPRTRGGQSGGFGEPLRLMIDLENTDDILAAFIYTPENHHKYLIVGTDARGFVASDTDVIAQTRSGKQVLVTDEKIKAKMVLPITGDHIAAIGQNRKLLVFPLSEMPELSRGRGVAIQKYKDGTLSDLVIFNIQDGLSWTRAGKSYTEKNLLQWTGKRASSGRLAPIGFSRANIFNG
jgi:topoisomerase-4 subunit A